MILDAPNSWRNRSLIQNASASDAAGGGAILDLHRLVWILKSQWFPLVVPVQTNGKDVSGRGYTRNHWTFGQGWDIIDIIKWKESVGTRKNSRSSEADLSKIRCQSPDPTGPNDIDSEPPRFPMSLRNESLISKYTKQLSIHIYIYR